MTKSQVQITSLSFKRQICVALCVGLGYLNVALTMAYSSSVILSMKNDPQFVINETQSSWVSAAVPAGALFGSLLAGYFVDRLGRKAMTQASAAALTTLWLCIALCNSACAVVFCRLLSGLCVGMLTVGSSVLSAELLERRHRAKFSVITSMSVPLGFLLGHVVAKMTNWREAAGVGSLIALTFIFLLCHIPETPFYLTRTGNKTVAFQSLLWLKVCPEESRKEYEVLERVVLKQDRQLKNSPNMFELLSAPYVWPVAVSTGLMIFQQLTGFHTVMLFSLSIFQMTNSVTEPGISSTILHVQNVLGVFLTAYAMAKFHRKWMLRVSSAVVVPSLWILSLFVYVKQNTTYSLPLILEYIPLVSLAVYNFGYAIGWATVPKIFLTEGLPSKARGAASAISLSTVWIMTFLITRFFTWCSLTCGMFVPFLCYGIFTFIAQILMEIYMPETFQKSLLAIEELYLSAYKKNL